MATHTADFEKGTLAANILVADAGSNDAWTAVNLATSSAVYDATHVAHGSNAAKLTVNGPGTVNLQWAAPGAENYGRLYWYATAAPASGGPITFVYWGSGGQLRWLDLGDVSPGKIGIFDDAGVLKATTTNTVSVNQWVRLEWHRIAGATGSIEIKLFNNADAALTSPTETLIASSINTGTSPSSSQYGTILNSFARTDWLDQVVDLAAAYPGSFPVVSVQPTVSGSTPVGSTLTATTGTWNGTFNYTYQWTRDGSNLGGATASTYVTVSGDAGHAVGCNVTATGQVAANESAVSSSSNTITPTGASTGNFRVIHRRRI